MFLDDEEPADAGALFKQAIRVFFVVGTSARITASKVPSANGIVLPS
jgi:hypothetical protein